MPQDTPIVMEDGKPTSTAQAASPAMAKQSDPIDQLAFLVKEIGQSLDDHKQASHGRSRTLLATVALLTALSFAGTYAYNELVTKPKLAEATALETQAKKSAEDTKALTQVLLESLAANNKGLTKTINGKLTALGFGEITK
jgi:Asp-tRNA(Asn)/Glu-tRNA(Gln) amidotransferase B subunit